MKANHFRFGQVEIVSQDENTVFVVKSDKTKVGLIKKFAGLKDDNGNLIDVFNLYLEEEKKVVFVKGEEKSKSEEQLKYEELRSEASAIYTSNFKKYGK